MKDAVIHLGVNLYYWGNAEQKVLLVDRIGPLVDELRADSMADRFWFTRFDARGPHLFLLFSTRAEHFEALRARLAEELEDAIAARPSRHQMSANLLRQRHEECRGKELCRADAVPGIADNNSFVLFEQEPSGYPFALSTGLPSAEEIWQAMDEAARWALDRVADERETWAAVSWLAGIDHALRDKGLASASYWRFHATTLLVPLAARLEEDEEQAIAALPAAIGQRNRELFSGVWSEPHRRLKPMPDIDRLVRLAVNGTGACRWPLLREINHTVLGQLDQPVRNQIPMVLFAWLQSLSPRSH